ncbi:MAG: hypothetical protein KIH63_004615 [Candidatus Saccharibacteria bacterium]|nr:hypothetical protein [Candidatus Saccharibacteria bacterium]
MNNTESTETIILSGRIANALQDTLVKEMPRIAGSNFQEAATQMALAIFIGRIMALIEMATIANEEGRSELRKMFDRAWRIAADDTARQLEARFADFKSGVTEND